MKVCSTENVGRKDLRIEYYIKNKNGEEVAYLKVLKAIETQASFMDSISIPASIPPGLYKISAQLNDYQELNQEVAASFNVVKENSIIERNLIIIIVVLGVVVFLVVIEMFILMKKNHEK
jgi:subtilase family serine protease